jgi:hypothetical protein
MRLSKVGKNEAVMEALSKPPLKFAILLGKDFVQIIAKVSSSFMASKIHDTKMGLKGNFSMVHVV